MEGICISNQSQSSGVSSLGHSLFYVQSCIHVTAKPLPTVGFLSITIIQIIIIKNKVFNSLQFQTNSAENSVTAEDKQLKRKGTVYLIVLVHSCDKSYYQFKLTYQSALSGLSISNY